MPKKLQVLFQNLQSKIPLLQRLKSLKQNPQSLNNISSDINETINFTENSDFHPVEHFGSKTFVIIFCSVFLLLFTYDSYLNYRLNTLKSTLLTRVSEDTKNKELEANYVSVAKSLGVYKSLLSSNNPFYNKLSVIYVDLPSGVTINELKIISNSFNLNLSSVNVISISQFIANLAKKPNISTVVLESATLNSSTGTYTVTLRGAFK